MALTDRQAQQKNPQYTITCIAQSASIIHSFNHPIDLLERTNVISHKSWASKRKAKKDKYNDILFLHSVILKYYSFFLISIIYHITRGPKTTSPKEIQFQFHWDNILHYSINNSTVTLFNHARKRPPFQKKLLLLSYYLLIIAL